MALYKFCIIIIIIIIIIMFNKYIRIQVYPLDNIWCIQNVSDTTRV